MIAKFSFRAQQALHMAREETDRMRHRSIDTEHILLGILRLNEGTAISTLTNLGCDLKKLRSTLEQASEIGELTLRIMAPPFSKQAERVIQDSYEEGQYFKSEMIGTEHLLLAVAKNEDGVASQVLAAFDVTYENIKRELESGMATDKKQQGKNKKSKTPALDTYGRDLTRLAKEGELDPIIGRDNEIERVAQILSRRKKNNPVLIGDPGVGKTAIVEGLALRITEQKHISPILYNKRVVMLDIGAIVAGTKYRGQFEERVKAIINEIEKNRDIIIFIDELHTLVGAGSASGSLDASNMLKPPLARGELQCIGATTMDEYRQHIEKDGALERRFQKVVVDPPSLVETIAILEGIEDRYEEHHSVVYTPEAIRKAVYLSDRYITDRFLPDKALDVLDETGSRVRLTHITIPTQILTLTRESEQLGREKEHLVKKQEYEQAAKVRDRKKRLDAVLSMEQKLWEQATRDDPKLVDVEQVTEVVAMMTGIPVNRVMMSESQRLLNIESELSKQIIGQDEAISVIARSIRRNRAGLNKRNRPIGSFIFLGPSGVGKTETARVLTEFLFDDANALIRIDMSEYMEKFNVSRLIGAPPGYVGYDEGGQLSERVRRKPYSIVLLDEIEKAHPDTFNMLLQVLDDGRMTDGSGRPIDFSNTILIMTSNLGTRETSKAQGGFGFQGDDSATDGDYRLMAEKMTEIMKEM
ncbi:MAG: ATP-dependent Clp protease ATP-binding subunit, partial [Candidatus Electryoneaceae bacterium]|nr:ATP-dependent Clp protease ATP-binding subunit [Candidatus Electryoneaceae bacterium]